MHGSVRDLGAASAAAGLLALASAAQAAIVDQNTVVAQDPLSGGQIEIVSTIFDNYMGDFSKWQFDYLVTNISFDPTPGTSNGLSGFNIVFEDQVGTVGDQYAPSGWFLNCCGTTPPFGAEADIDNATGFGIAIGNEDSFGYTVPAGTPYTDTYEGSWAHSWENDIQMNTFGLVDVTDGHGPLVPVPEPTTGLLFAFGALALGPTLRHH